MACGQLLFVFLRKNFLYLCCNRIPLIFIFAACIGALGGYISYTVKPHRTELEFSETKDYYGLKQYFPANDYDFIYYSPTSENVESIMDLLRQELEISAERFQGKNSAEDMQQAMEQQCHGRCFSIDFQQVPDVGSTDRFQYSLSSNEMRISPKKRFVNDDEINHQKDDDEYVRTGFLTLQYILDRLYMKYHRINDNIELQLISMPNLEVGNADSYRFIYFGTLFSILFSVLLLSTFIVPFVEEKQNGLKEFLNLVTPMSFLNGLTFSLIRFLCYVIFLIIVFILAQHNEVFGLINFGYAFTLFLLYILATMSYAYLISVFFHSVFYAKIGGLMLLIMPYMFNFVRSGFTNLAYCLLSTNTFLEGLDVFQTFSNKHRQFTGSELFREIKDNSSRIFWIYMVLILQTILYALLYNYLACVFPGPGGVKRPFLFFLNPDTYKKRQRNEYTTSPRGTEAVIIKELCKTFRTNKRETLISDHLNMTIKNKEITVLLGHNGAGKTTMMNMIMGLVPKDSGKILVCSERDVASYRHLIGFCPQHSVFMSYMTCQQHLEFFAELRGSSRGNAQLFADEMLLKLNLQKKANEYGRDLSGGMKRRLSLGIALAGDTKIVILDEPSSGLDIESRRELWDILLNLRKSKAIMVTTHYMEEAEVLGDTICILANGKLQCSGAPLELKRKWGRGYRLKLLACDDRFKEIETLDLIRAHIPSAYLLNFVKPTVYISLPYDDKLKYHDMLRELESNTNRLGIETISISDTSLEDVFLNCAGETDQVDTPDASRNDAPLLTPYVRLKDRPMEPSWWQLWAAIFYKKITFLRNKWLYTSVMLSIPIICVIGAIILMHAMSVVTNEDVLPLNLSKIPSGRIYMYNPANQNAQLEQMLRQQIASSGHEVQNLNLRGENSLRDELLALQGDNLADFLDQVIGLVEMDSDGSVRLHYAGNICHSSVVLVNLFDSSRLKLLQTEEAGIDSTYVPIRRYVTDISPTRLEYYAIIVSVGMFFSMFYYIVLPFREHVSGFKQLQSMSRYTYWSATFCFDLLLHLGVCLALWLVQLLIMLPMPAELYGSDELLGIVTSIFFYGCSYLPILYCLANNFKSISTISTYLLLMLIVSAIAPLITSGNTQAMKEHQTLIFFLCFLPDFNLNHQLRIVNENLIARHRSGPLQLLSTGTFYAYAVFVCLVVMGFFTFILEDKYRRNILSSLNCKWPNKGSTSDVSSLEAAPAVSDCAQEQQRVEAALRDRKMGNFTDENQIIVSGLRKRYKNKIAVDGIDFGAMRGECFGLLGVNGAGKTTTFQMIAANLAITAGSAQIENIDIREQEVAYRYRFGYCPQYDALNKFMTAEQSLLYMGRLRGLNSSAAPILNLQYSVNYWLEKMNLLKYRHVQVRHYSGGTKRKLLTALAMIGGPPLVLLDEPTTGVDPISRRFLWQCIKDFQQGGRTVVLTSHSMDECEELCNRLAIMADGKFKCLNNICALKRLSGFTIKLKMKPDTETTENVNCIIRKLKDAFVDSELRENHAGMLTFIVRSDQHISWSDVFKTTEEYLSNQLSDFIEDYSVNECTLEDIFLKFDQRNKSRSPSAQCFGSPENV